MTRDEIIEMARRAGSIDSEDVILTVYNAFSSVEREACAKVAAEWVRAYPHPSGIIENNILARGEA